MKIEAARRFTFCCAHRILGHESKCADLHGHNYVLNVYAESTATEATATELIDLKSKDLESKAVDDLGRVVDFSVLKEKIDPWLQDNWDHTVLVFEQDYELLKIEKLFPKKRPWYICSFNPTAENMGIFLMKKILPELLTGIPVRISRLELWETENCKVVIRP